MVSNDTSAVFIYTGKGQTVPKDVISVRFHPSVTEVENMAFKVRSSLREVVLNEGLLKIGALAFEKCTALQCIKLPTTVLVLVHLKIAIG